MKNLFDSGRNEAGKYRFKMYSNRLRGMTGDRQGSGIGNSIEFQEYKDYEPGDDIRSIDWRIYGKTDRLIVKKYREELQPKAEIFTDISCSLNFPDNVKAEAALFLSGFFLENTICSGTISSWWTFGNGFIRILPYSTRLPEIKPPPFTGKADIAVELADVHFTNNSVRIIISDFLWEAEPETTLRKMSDKASAVYLISLLSEKELEPVLSGYNTLIDSESGETVSLLLNRETIDVYKRNLKNHLELWEEVSVKHGAVYTFMKAEDILANDLSALVRNGIIEAV
jgi:hypothetical protein